MQATPRRPAPYSAQTDDRAPARRSRVWRKAPSATGHTGRSTRQCGAVRWRKSCGLHKNDDAGDAKAWSTLQGQAQNGAAMQIGEIAAATGISRDTLRFYEKRGLL